MFFCGVISIIVILWFSQALGSIPLILSMQIQPVVLRVSLDKNVFASCSIASLNKQPASFFTGSHKSEGSFAQDSFDG